MKSKTMQQIHEVIILGFQDFADIADILGFQDFADIADILGFQDFAEITRNCIITENK